MSEYTREEILKLIEGNGGPEGLDLSGKDLSGIDLSREAIRTELEKERESAPDAIPVWYCEWADGVNLKGVILERADLTYAELQGAWLVEAHLQMAQLWDAKLQWAILSDARLEGAYLWLVNLREALLDHANLQTAELSGAELQGALLASTNLKEASLRGANLQEAKLWEANLQGADLSHSHLEKVNLSAAESLQGTHFYNAFLDDTRMKREQLRGAIGEELEGWYDQARDAYLRLKQNFDVLGDYAASAWAYQKERQMEKACNAPWRARSIYGQTELGDTHERRVTTWHPRVWWFYIRHTLKWFSDWFVEYLCGYGESIGWVVTWMLLVIVGFAAYYQVTHAVVTSSQDAATSLWDHLIFSLGAFTTLQPARLQAARPGVELLTTIQAIIGISLAGLLGFVAGNRIRRS
jgi:uncharacterized protein YjbI with pentapeptide repeats